MSNFKAELRNTVPAVFVSLDQVYVKSSDPDRVIWLRRIRIPKYLYTSNFRIMYLYTDIYDRPVIFFSIKKSKMD